MDPLASDFDGDLGKGLADSSREPLPAEKRGQRLALLPLRINIPLAPSYGARYCIPKRAVVQKPRKSARSTDFSELKLYAAGSAYARI